jgi:excisionase family DNA binding protein
VTELLPLSTTCARLSVKRKALLALVRRGELPALKVGREWRFDPDDVDAFIARQKQALMRPAAAPIATKTTRRSTPRTGLNWKGAGRYLQAS